MPRHVHPALQAYIATGKPMVRRDLIWFRARLVADGSPVAGGFWDGRYDQELQVIDPATGGNVARVYHAAGSVLEIEPMGQFSGLDIHPIRVTLNAVNEQVNQALRAYHLAGAGVEFHRMYFDYDTRTPIAPGRVWKIGTINKAPRTTPAAGGQARLVLTIVPPTRALTIGNPEILSDDIQRQRGGDRILRYIAQVGSREIPWMRGSANGPVRHRQSWDELDQPSPPPGTGWT